MRPALRKVQKGLCGKSHFQGWEWSHFIFSLVAPAGKRKNVLRVFFSLSLYFIASHFSFVSYCHTAFFFFFLCFYPGCSPDSRIPYMIFFFFHDPVLLYLDSLRRSLFGLVHVTEETLLWHPKREMQELGPSGSRYSVK